MANQIFKFGWVIKDFSSLRCEWCCSVPVFIGDNQWRLVAYPNGDHCGFLSLFLDVDLESLPCGWRGFADYRLTIVNQHFKHLSVQREEAHWFDKIAPSWGFRDMIPLVMLNAINGGFLENGELMIIAEVEVLEVINTMNASQVEEISDETEQRAHADSFSSEDLQNKDDVTIEVNGFHVLDSQVNQVKAIFQKHPDLTSNFNVKNQHIKNAYMCALLELIKTLCKSTKELTVEDLNKADNTLTDLIKAGLNLDWLRQKLDQALEKQIDYDTRIRELEKHVKNRRLALAKLEADLEKEKAAASAALVLFD